MIGGGPRIRPRGLQVLAFCLALCVTPLGLPGQVIRSLGEAAWAAGIAALAGGALGMWSAVRVARQSRRGEDIVGSSRRSLGPLVGLGYSWLLGLLLAVGMPINLGIFAQVATTRELPFLPQAYSAVMIGAAATLACAYGLEVVVRVAEVLAPLLALGILVVFASAFANARFDAIVLEAPPLSSRSTVLLAACLGMARGFLAALVVGARTYPRPRLAGLMAANALAAFLILLSVELPLLVFSPRLASQLQFPFVTVSGTVTWQWLPTYKLEVYLLLVWQALALVVAAAYPVLAAEVLSPLTGISKRYLAIGLAVAGTIAAGIWVSPVRREHFSLAWNLAVVLLGIAVPVILALHPGQRHRLASGRLGGP